LRGIRTGLKDEQIRQHLKPFLDPRRIPKIEDEELLRETNIICTESEEIFIKQQRKRSM